MCFCQLKKWIGSSHEYWYKGLDFFFFFFLIVFMECCEMTLFHKCVWTNAFLLRAWILVFTYAVLINLARKNYIRLSGLNRCLKFMKFACMFSYVNPRKVFISQSMYILVPSQSTCWFAARFHSWCLWHLTSWIPKSFWVNLTWATAKRKFWDIWESNDVDWLVHQPWACGLQSSKSAAFSSSQHA